MRRFIITLITLVICSMPVGAEEKVWYCEMIGHATANAEGDKVWSLEKFKMKVTPGEVVFGSGGFFNNLNLTFQRFMPHDLWIATSAYSNAIFKDNLLFYSQASTDTAFAISARCDDF